MIFCDTSTIAKLYVPEAESVAVRTRLDAEDGVYASELARPELMAVFHRRMREKRWSQADFAVAVRQFSADDISGYWTWLPLDGTIAEAGAKVLSSLPDSVHLRTADCLHLVTALHHGFSEIHTHDKHQATGAAALGLTAITLS